MLLRLFNDETPLQDHSKDRFLKKEENRVDDEGGAVERNGEAVAGGEVDGDGVAEGEADGEGFAPGGADEDVLPDAV